MIEERHQGRPMQEQSRLRAEDERGQMLQQRWDDIRQLPVQPRRQAHVSSPVEVQMAQQAHRGLRAR